jgi:hypothetical protein
VKALLELEKRRKAENKIWEQIRLLFGALPGDKNVFVSEYIQKIGERHSKMKKLG